MAAHTLKRGDDVKGKPMSEAAAQVYMDWAKKVFQRRIEEAKEVALQRGMKQLTPFLLFELWKWADDPLKISQEEVCEKLGLKKGYVQAHWEEWLSEHAAQKV